MNISVKPESFNATISRRVCVCVSVFDNYSSCKSAEKHCIMTQLRKA